jgi:hypothetical protein
MQSNTELELTSLQDTEAQSYSQAVLNSQEYQNFKQRVQQQFAKVFTPRDALLEVVAVSVGQDRTIIVRIPFEGGAGDSSFVAVFQPNSTTITETRSALFTQTEGGNTHILAEVNGTVEVDATIDPSGTFQNGSLTKNGRTVALDGLTAVQAFSQVQEVFAPAASRASSGFFECFANCLQRQGVGANATALGGLCLSACAVPAVGTAICAGCLAAVVGIGVGQAISCVRQC